MSGINKIGGEGSVNPAEQPSQSAQVRRKRPGVDGVDLGDATDVKSNLQEAPVEDTVVLSQEALDALRKSEEK